MYSRCPIRTAFLLLFFCSITYSGTPISKKMLQSQIRLNSTNSDPWRPSPQTKLHNCGSLITTVSNYGVYGSPTSTEPSMKWPGEEGNNYLWAGSIWVAGMINGEKLVSGWDYLNTSEWQPTLGSTFVFGSEKAPQDHMVTYDDLEPNEAHQPLGIQVIERGLTWNTKKYDDFIVYEYEIENVGEDVINNFYVGWLFDFDILSIPDRTDQIWDDLVDYEGWDGEDTDSDELDVVDPLDLDEDGYTGYDEWGWPYGLPMNRDGIPSNPNFDANLIEPDGFFDEWQIILDSKGPVLHWQTNRNPAYKHAGEVAVLDGDTLRGYAIPRNTSYMFDHDNFETPGIDIGNRDGDFPAQGFAFCRLLYSDIIHETGVFPYLTADEDTMMRPYAHQWWEWSAFPGTDYEQYDFLAATHSFATQKNKHYHFMPLPFEIDAPVFDYRILQSTGPFITFRPGRKLRFVIVAGLGQGFQGMRENADAAVLAYYSGSKRSNPYQPSSPDFYAEDGDIHWSFASAPPSPRLNYSSLDEAIQLSWDNAPESVTNPMINKIDFEGYKVYRSVFDYKHWEMIAVFDNLDEPVLVKNTEGDILNSKKDLESGEIFHRDTPGYQTLQNYEYIKTDLPQITHAFIDSGGTFLGKVIARPRNGLKYYYSVVAYNSPQPARPPFPALDSQESAKDNYLQDEESGLPIPITPKRYYADGEEQNVILKNVKVVPNPYKGTSLFESMWEEKVQFTNLPPVCKISIFTPAGDLVDTIYHQDGTNSQFWPLITRNQMRAVSGLYLFVVETEKPEYEKYIGKMVIIR